MNRKNNLQTLIVALEYELEAEATASNGNGDINRFLEVRGIARRRLNAMTEKEDNQEAERLKGVPSVDRCARILASGKSIPEDQSHTVLKPSGQQQDYVVLTESERHKGYVRPVRDAYRHLKCGKITTMSRAIAETYARDPDFYTGTFCSTCCGHVPIGENGEFTWYEMDGSTGPKVGT